MPPRNGTFVYYGVRLIIVKAMINTTLLLGSPLRVLPKT